MPHLPHLRHLLPAVTLAVGLSACGVGIEADVTTGSDDPSVAPADDGDQQHDDRSDETSMPTDDDTPHDGSISQGEAEAVATAYLGLTEEEAVAQAAVDDRPFRVGARDGEQYMLTEDYVVGRITVTVTDGVVTAATVEATDTQVHVDA